MKATATPLIIAALMATHAYALECGRMPADTGDKRMLRTSDDAMSSLLSDAVVMGASTRSKNRLVAVSTDKDDAAVMSSMKKTTARGRAMDMEGSEKEAHTRMGMGMGDDDEMPLAGVAVTMAKDTMRVQSDAAKDTAKMSKTSATILKAKDEDKQKKDDDSMDKDRR